MDVADICCLELSLICLCLSKLHHACLTYGRNVDVKVPNVREEQIRDWRIFPKELARSKSNTFRHFQGTIFSKTSTYTAMTKYDEGMSLSRKSGGGHLGVENTCILGWSHEKGHGRKNGPSLARASTKFKISQQYVYKTLRFKIILRYRPRKRVSYATKTRQIKIYALQPENQRKTKNTCCRKRRQSVNSLEFGTD